MKTYNVYIYVAGCYNVEVQADNERDAKEKVIDELCLMNVQEFVDAINPQYDGYDIYER